MSARYAVEPIPGPMGGWLVVMDTHRRAPEAQFAARHRDLADEMAARLNVRELAAELRAAPNAAPGFRRLELTTAVQSKINDMIAKAVTSTPKYETGGSLTPRPLRDDERPAHLSDGLAVVPDAALERYGHQFFSAIGNVPADRVFGISEVSAPPLLAPGTRVRALPGTGCRDWLEGTVVTPTHEETVPVPGPLVYFRTDDGELRWAPAHRVELLPNEASP